MQPPPLRTPVAANQSRPQPCHPQYRRELQQRCRHVGARRPVSREGAHARGRQIASGSTVECDPAGYALEEPLARLLSAAEQTGSVTFGGVSTANGSGPSSTTPSGSIDAVAGRDDMVVRI